MAYHNPDPVPVVEKKRKIIVRFRNSNDIKEFSEKVGVNVNNMKTIKFSVIDSDKLHFGD